MEKVSAQLVTIMEDHLRVGGFNTMSILTQGKEARELYSLVLNTSHGTLIQEALKFSPPNPTIHSVFEQKFAMPTMPASS